MLGGNILLKSLILMRCVVVLVCVLDFFKNKVAIVKMCQNLLRRGSFAQSRSSTCGLNKQKNRTMVISTVDAKILSHN